MSGPLSNDEALEVGLRMGIPRDKLERSLGLCFPSRVQPTAAPDLARTVPLPFTLTVEWTLLVSDDKRYGKPQARRTKDGRMVVQNILSKEYRAAKVKLENRLRARLNGALPVRHPLHIAYHFYWPDRRIHDASNHFKLLNDVMSKIVYKDDAQLARGSWQTSVDPDRPRCEIEIHPL